MNFYELYNLLNENIEQNFDSWLDLLIKYAKPIEKENLIYYSSEIKNNLGSPDRSKIIKDVLKEKNLENFNWFSFCMGYYSVKSFRKEDLELAIDVTRKAIDSRELPKTEIGIKGWYQIGKEAKKRTEDYLIAQNQLSNREIERRKKRGESLVEDENTVKLIIDEDNIKVYFFPGLKLEELPDVHKHSDADVLKIKNRHAALCKYGKNTDWCTSQPSWTAHEDYIWDDIFILHENDKPLYQFVGCLNAMYPDSLQFMDNKDRRVESLPKKIFDILNKKINFEINCYNLKFEIESIDDFLNQKDLDNINTESLAKITVPLAKSLNDEDDQKNWLILNKIFNKIIYHVNILSSKKQQGYSWSIANKKIHNYLNVFSETYKGFLQSPIYNTDGVYKNRYLKRFEKIKNQIKAGLSKSLESNSDGPILF